MELQKIEQLLDKYWDGDTSLEEEQILQNFFTEVEVPEHLQGVAILFRKLRTDRQFKTLDDRFDETIIHKIEKSDSAWSFRTLLRIAAAVTLLLLSVFLVKDYIYDQTGETAEVPENLENSYEDPKLAYEQTKQALLLISSMMNEGAQHIEKLENFSDAQEKVKENTL
ncbi:hypothetical protein OKW21_001422 [Catalinimonas alkaloidigena]|uniref:hypothetical protein n=1 Tax=Catalinimonas alkaloidigena TaxID=1075417 RepID=UPI00240659C6|nr:hypothetical protein [Catalinimonas alkaloidigena]MDF9796159.1 hypothetical protein [Catalinimonas alkaloidigena]